MNQTTPLTTVSTRRHDQALSLNMRLLAHHELEGFGGIGEGMAMQLARDPSRSAAGGSPARAKAIARHRRNGSIRNSTPAFARTTPTYFRSGRTARMSVTSMAAR